MAGSGNGSGTGNGKANGAARKPITVLIVDDERTFGEALEVALDREKDLRVIHVATDGQEAVELWQSYDPDLIWMDTRMPRMDGPSATREIRRLEAESSRDHVPIIAVTAGVLETEETDLLRAGYDAVVAKPFRTDTIFGMLKRHLPSTYQSAGNFFDLADYPNLLGAIATSAPLASAICATRRAQSLGGARCVHPNPTRSGGP